MYAENGGRLLVRLTARACILPGQNADRPAAPFGTAGLGTVFQTGPGLTGPARPPGGDGQGPPQPV